MSLLKKAPAKPVEVQRDPRPGDIVQEGDSRWLLLPGVVGGVRRALVDPKTWPGVGSEWANGDIGPVDWNGDPALVVTTMIGTYLVLRPGEDDQEVRVHGPWRMHAPPLASTENPRLERRWRGKPWWARTIPLTPATLALLDEASVDTPPPWADAARADEQLRVYLSDLDESQAELAAGPGDGMRAFRVRESIENVDKLVVGRLSQIRSAWIDEHASGPTVDTIESRTKIFVACWWLTRDGSGTEVRFFEAEARRIDPEVFGYFDRFAALEEARTWLVENGIALPDLPDLPAAPRSLDEALARRSAR